MTNNGNTATAAPMTAAEFLAWSHAYCDANCAMDETCFDVDADDNDED
jgi:hypothetical protein